MIQDYIEETKDYVETQNIYQEIIDEIFEAEIKKICEDPDILEVVGLQKSMYTQKSTLFKNAL